MIEEERREKEPQRPRHWAQCPLLAKQIPDNEKHMRVMAISRHTDTEYVFLSDENWI